MIDMLVKEIKLYNNKIEIYFKYNRSSKDIENENLQIYDKTEQITVYNQPQPKDTNKRTNIKIASKLGTIFFVSVFYLLAETDIRICIADIQE